MPMDNQAPEADADTTRFSERLSQRLAEAESLSAGMSEAKDMCLHVIERIAAGDPKAKTSEPEMPSQDADAFVPILEEFAAFLKSSSNMKAVFRLVRNRSVVEQIRTLHVKLDTLRCELDLPQDDWHQRWEKYRICQQAAFQAMSRDRMALVRDLQDAQAQAEALTLIMFEFNKVDAGYTKEQRAILQNAFNIVSVFSKATATNAVWILPPYEFECEERMSARGGFATVHYGRHCGARVVVKRIQIANEKSRKGFINEVNAWFVANRIPNVMHLYGAYPLGPEPYFVCEYAKNGTLSDYLFNKCNRQFMWKLMYEAALGLKGLHQFRIVHNDLKCNNILAMADGIAKITDFGLSSQVSVRQALSVRPPVGAYSWKAPELLTKNPTPSYASDVYAFGMRIYEAVSHSMPWVEPWTQRPSAM